MTDAFGAPRDDAYRACEIPADLWYDVPSDVWLRPEADGTVTLGMTDPAQTRSGKLVHIQFKRVGRHIEAGQSVATVETAKWVGPFPSPVPATIVATNEAGFGLDMLVANRDPYGSGWLARISPDGWDPRGAGLLTGADAFAAYRERIDELDVSCLRCAD